MTNEDLLARVRELRERGSSPKQIAKVLGLPPSTVAPLVREVAALQQTHADPADRALLGCWINPGWSAGLGLDEAPPDWAAGDSLAVDEEVLSGGLAGVLIARQERASRVSVCGYLVDVFCLGVKNALGPLPTAVGAIDTFRDNFFSAFEASPITAPLELAQHLVHGAVAYARGLGFEPHADFADAAPYLGTPTGPTPIRFGRDGKPFYVSGPNDKPREVIRTLESTAGPGNYHYLTQV